MKSKINIIAMLIAFAAVIQGCVKDDNFSAPNASVSGAIIDSVTGRPIQLRTGDAHIYVTQTNYTKGTAIPFSWNVKQDGTYNNSEVFAEDYLLYPQPSQGPFVPLYFTYNGATVDHGSKKISMKSGQNVVTNFTVAPFLEVSWVGDPVLNANGTVSVQVNIVRGTTNPYWIADVTDVFLFVNQTSDASLGDYDNTISTDVTYTGTAGDAILGTTVTITSPVSKPLPPHQGYFIRVGARTADRQAKQYNYTSVKQINIP